MKKKFNAKISKLLNLTTHSIYSDKSMAIRELISNASDACNKLRVKMLQEGDEIKDFKIKIEIDKNAKTISILDNGIGMSAKELESNLGTIAESGTEIVADSDKTAERDLIGRFGIGFYSSFMIADSVTAISKKYQSDELNKWTAEDYEGFEINMIEADQSHGIDSSGTRIILHISSEDRFLDKDELSRIIKQHSYHVNIPILLSVCGDTKEDSNESEQIDVEEVINTERSIWRERNLKKSKMREFYKANYYSTKDPMWSMHTFAEGAVEYTALLFVPHEDMARKFYTTRESCNIKLYAKGILIQEDFKEMLPPFLRFIEGIIDCYDIDLNISREILQQSGKIAKIKESIVKKILKSLTKAKNFDQISKHYGPIIKEGICDFQYQKEVLQVSKFTSSMKDEPITVGQYVELMPEDQKEIMYIFGHEKEVLLNTPQVRTLKDKGINTLVFTDAIDEIWVNMIMQHEGKSFKSAIASDKGEVSEELKPLIAAIEKRIPSRFSSVTVSNSLADVPVFVSQDSASDNPLMRMMNTGSADNMKYVLEINPNHEITKKLSSLVKIEAAETQNKVNSIIDTLIFVGLSKSSNQWKSEELDLSKSVEGIIEAII